MDWIRTNNNCVPNEKAAVKIPDRICFSALCQVELPSAIENVGFEPLLCVPNAACCSLHHILISCSSGNRTRASGATVRRTYRYTMELYCLCRTINSSPHAAQRLALRALTKKAACLFGQAAVSALITAIYLVTPWLALRRLVPDITWSGLIKAYTNRPFRVLGGRHNCPLKIKQAMCIIHSVCIHLQHCLAFPFRTCCPFFTMLNISLVVPAVILPVV